MDIQFLIPVAHAASEAVAAESASSGGIATLGLNGKLFIAQLVNFAVLLLLFWKLILPGLVKGLQSRTQRIEKSLQDAERVEKEKQEFSKWREEEMSKARLQASEIVTKAQSEAGAAKDRAIAQTKEEQQKVVEQASTQIKQEKDKALSSAKAEIADMVTQAAEKILRQKLDAKKDEALIKESLKSI